MSHKRAQVDADNPPAALPPNSDSNAASRHKSDARADVAAGAAARRLAAAALERIDEGGAFANIVLPFMLGQSDLEPRDRAFVTELVYGATRMRRACDWLVDRFVMSELDSTARAFLRIGAYQLVFLGTPPHAAVSATVDAAPRKLRGLVNAVLRRVAENAHEWPDEATGLSYPNWIIDSLVADLGRQDAIAALESMNKPAAVEVREDGYTQDLASQWVADAVGAAAGELVLDLCAAPGGKATRMAQAGANVVAADVRIGRIGLVTSNSQRLDIEDRVWAMAADGGAPPFRTAAFDRILVDAPCSGLGALRRRPDARWRVTPHDVEVLVALQIKLVDAARPLLRPGGVLVYSVCTLTQAETLRVDEHLAGVFPELNQLRSSHDDRDHGWRPVGRGLRILPQDAGTDGMYVLRLQAPV